jgi:23S rRNA (cytidine1920-2'-O)/16S rRNA (cytidine1409-2'-O)-methyltransferase
LGHKKKRLDQQLLDMALFKSREEARTAIMDGGILVNGEKVTKAGEQVSESDKIELIESYKRCPYVSRGGFKLEKAIEHFAVPVSGKVALDVGASTGGFTDCLLQNGAQFVYAIDVGYGQIDWKLRQSEKVCVLERTNIRYLESDKLYKEEESPRASLCVMDVSFISVKKTLPKTLSLMATGEIALLILIKPQFEAGKDKVGKGGVVREKESHVEILCDILTFTKENLGLKIAGLTHSPIKGPSGNIEYLLYAKRSKEDGQRQALSAEEQSEIKELAESAAELAFNSL